jgi:hypothetical protein
VIASTLRPQPLTRASLRVQIKSRDTVEYDGRTEEPADIEPQKVLSLQCQFSFPEPGPITFLADCEFFADQTPLRKHEEHTLTLIPPFKVNVSFTPPHLFYEIESCFPFPVWDLAVAVRGVEKRVIAHLLEAGESVRGITRLESFQPNLLISWNLSFARDLRCQPLIPPPPPAPAPHPIRLSFLNVPRFVHTLVPFDVTMVLRNELEKPLDGDVTISLEEESINIYGNNRVRFHGIGPKQETTFTATFIALLEGDFPFPPCVFNVAGQETFTVKPNDGILVIGNG